MNQKVNNSLGYKNLANTLLDSNYNPAEQGLTLNYLVQYHTTKSVIPVIFLLLLLLLEPNISSYLAKLVNMYYSIIAFVAALLTISSPALATIILNHL
jgi:hypothetical protein